ncbi:MAG: glycosyltransferase family 2 protein [Desulfobacterales bacterium]|jgi:glycosyltransferase involved in cell wall biosynthesis|nr:glycosyltransferase family 2 protein [Desulfobacterales bacterium]
MTSFSEVIPGLVSTIIPVYNRPQMIRKAVESVLSQTYRPIEIIVVNDGSTDETPNVLDELKSSYPQEITVIRKENGGPGLAREAGRLKAKGEYIQYLDSDDWLLPEKFMIQVNALKVHPECGIAYGISRLVDDQGDVLEEPSKWTGKKIDYLFPALLVDRWWHTHTPLYSRKISDLAGPWPKQRPEDWDLEARMGAFRPKLIFCDTPVSCHRHHFGDNRVSQGAKDDYLRDESWFLPRLYECAVRAGVPADAPEMQHFSRWAFSLSRRVGALGESRAAWDLLALSKKNALGPDYKMSLVGWSARFFGWRFTGRAFLFFEKLIHYKGGSVTLPH